MAASQQRFEPSRLIVVMGVAGCGKSAVGEALAAALGGIFLDGDTYHPPRNIEKMSRGEPLNDDDRWPWLDRFAKELASRAGTVVGGCSALKKVYRTHITAAAAEPVLFVHLVGNRALIAERMKSRTGHFMPTSLLDSQFAALEVPTADENALSIEIDRSIDDIIEDITSRIERSR